VGLYGNIIFPLKAVNIPNNGLFDLQDVTDFHNFKFVMDLLIGPVFILYKNERFSFPISVGFHWVYFSTVFDNEFEYKNNYIGVGANIAGRYNINNLISIFARFQFAYDFYGFYKEGSALTKTWNISPSLGISFRF